LISNKFLTGKQEIMKYMKKAWEKPNLYLNFSSTFFHVFMVSFFISLHVPHV